LDFLYAEIAGFYDVWTFSPALYHSFWTFKLTAQQELYFIPRPCADGYLLGVVEEISKYNVQAQSIFERLWLVVITFMQNDVLATRIMPCLA